MYMFLPNKTQETYNRSFQALADLEVDIYLFILTLVSTGRIEIFKIVTLCMFETYTFTLGSMDCKSISHTN